MFLKKKKTCETVQRHKFHSRVRGEGESVATFVSELRSIATFCNFGDRLDEMLRDRIMCGIANKKIQDRLLSESKLDFKKAMEISLSLEEAAKRAKELQPPVKPPADVHQVKHYGKNDGIVCHRCGSKGHKAPACRFKNAKCHSCGKIGHLKRVCKEGPPVHREGIPHTRYTVFQGRSLSKVTSTSCTTWDLIMTHPRSK